MSKLRGEAGVFTLSRLTSGIQSQLLDLTIWQPPALETQPSMHAKARHKTSFLLCTPIPHPCWARRAQSLHFHNVTYERRRLPRYRQRSV